MAGANVHVQGEKRLCGHTTVVSGQDFVSVQNQLVAVENDQDTAGHGELTSMGINTYVKINNKLIIVKGDQAKPDSACMFNNQHCRPYPSEFSDFVTIEPG